MSNSKFTEAARSSREKNPLKSIIYKANPPSRRIHLQETVGFNQLYFAGKEKKVTLVLLTLPDLLFANLGEAV